MNAEKVTLKAARRALKTLATEHPDMMRGCLYVDEEGCPNCLVGVILVDEYGVSPDVLRKVNSTPITFLSGLQEPFSTEVGNKARLFRMDSGVTFTKKAVLYLRIAQQEQDFGATWAEAHVSAEEWVKDPTTRPYLP